LRFSPPVPGHGDGHHHVNLAADEVGGQCRQPIIVALRPAVFQCQVLSHDVAALAQSLVERGYKRIRVGRRNRAEVADHRHRLLLRTRGQRPRRCAAEQHDEIAALHFDLLVGAERRGSFYTL
jgi:hypothetical protein